MSWVLLALVGAAVLALVNMFDKTVHGYSRTPDTLPLFIGVAQTTIGVVVLALVVGIGGVPDGATWSMTATALGSGALYGVGASLMIRVLFHQEVSRTIPVTQTAPIFAALMGVAFLGEAVTAAQWLAILATVVGAVAISVRVAPGGGGTSVGGVVLQRSFFVLLLGSAIVAGADVVGKVALEELPVLFTHGLRVLGIGVVYLVWSARREPMRNIAELVRSRSPALKFVVANELVIANVALLLLLWALSLGPVSLVTALAATRAMFVVLYSTTLALVWKGALGEVTTRRAVAVKVGSTAVIVAGVAGIAI